jgi:hypothetical protein
VRKRDEDDIDHTFRDNKKASPLNGNRLDVQEGKQFYLARPRKEIE